MAARGDRHSRLVNLLKVLLPISALGLLSTLFFFSGEVDPSQSIPYVELNVEQLAEEQRVSAPYFAGVTEQGVAITLTGVSAIPDQDIAGNFTLEAMEARLESDDGSTFNATADRAAVDASAGTSTLEGNTEITTSDGLRVTTPGLRITMESGDLESLGAIEAVGPFGEVRADSMVIARAAPDRPHGVVFQGNVRVLYDPESE